MITVLCCGSRTFADRTLVHITLDQLHADEPFGQLLHGAAQGADLLCASWAFRWRVPIRAFLAEWNRYGPTAGLIRNQRMLTEGRPQLVVAFIDRPLDQSRGTYDMVKRAKLHGVHVHVVRSLPSESPVRHVRHAG